MTDPQDLAPSGAVDPEAKTAADVAGGAGPTSLGAGLRDLANDAQTLVEAELAYQSARAAYVWNAGQAVVVWLLVALAAAFFALVALVVGLLLALIPVLGVWLALGVIALGLALVAAISLTIALRRVTHIRSRALAADPVVAPKRVAAPQTAGPPPPPPEPAQ